MNDDCREEAQNLLPSPQNPLRQKHKFFNLNSTKRVVRPFKYSFIIDQVQEETFKSLKFIRISSGTVLLD